MQPYRFALLHSVYEIKNRPRFSLPDRFVFLSFVFIENYKSLCFRIAKAVCMRMQSTEQNDDKVPGKNLQMSISESQLVAPLSPPINQVENSKSDINAENRDATSANQGNISGQVETATNNSEAHAAQPAEKDTFGIFDAQ